MTKTPMIEIREIVRGIILNKISDIVDYEIHGSDFVNRVIGELPETDQETDIISTFKEGKEMDMELYNKFIDHLTDLSMSRMKIW